MHEWKLHSSRGLRCTPVIPVVIHMGGWEAHVSLCSAMATAASHYKRLLLTGPTSLGSPALVTRVRATLLHGTWSILRPEVPGASLRHRFVVQTTIAEDEEVMSVLRHGVQGLAVRPEPRENLFADGRVDAPEPVRNPSMVLRGTRALIAMLIPVEPIDGPPLDPSQAHHLLATRHEFAIAIVNDTVQVREVWGHL